MRRIQFLDFELDLDLLTLTRSGRIVPAGRRCLDLLIYLINNRHQFSSLETLRSEVWQGAHLSPAAIPTCVSDLRKILSDTPNAPRLIESKRGRGYRFIGQCVFSRPESLSLINSSKSTETPHIGHRSETSALHAALRATTIRQELKCVLVRGEAGIGKSRLIDEFLRELPPAIRRLAVRCSRLAPHPLGPWRTLFEKVVDDATSPLGPEETSAIRDKLRLEEADLGEVTSDRIGFYSAWTSLVRQVVSKSTVILVFEDIHLADVESLRLLAWIVEMCGAVPLLLVLTQRPRVWSEQADELINEIAAFPNVELIDVQPLAKSDAQQIILFHSGDLLSSSDALWQSAGGNPFLLSHAIRSAQTETTETGVGELTGRAFSRNVDLVMRLSSDLPSDSRRLLSIASVVGASFPSEVLAKVSGLDWNSAIRHLEEARKARLLISTKSGYEFTHPLFRMALESIMDPAARKQIHAEIADALIQFCSSENSAVAVAFHMVSAVPLVDISEARRLAEIALRASIERGDFLEAKTLAEQALRLLDRSPDGEVMKRCELMLALAKCHRTLGERREERKVVLEASRIARSEGLDGLLICCALALSEEFSTIEVGVHDVVVEDLLREAVDRCPQDDLGLLATLLARLSLSLRWSSDGDEQLALAKRAYEMARDTDDEIAFQNAVSAMVECNAGVAQAEMRLGLLRELEARGLGRMGRGDLLLHHVRKITALLEVGDLDRIASENRAYRELADCVRQPQYIWYAETTDVMRLLLKGKLDFPPSLEANYRDVLRLSEDPNVIQGYAAQIFFREVECCRQENVITPLVEIATRYPLVSGWRVAEAWLQWTLGDGNECMRLLSQLTEDRIVRMTKQVGSGAALGMLCEAASCFGSRDLRHLLWELVEPLADRCATAGYGVLYFGGYSRYAGLLARSIGMESKALELLSLSVQQEASRGAELWRAYSLIDFALMLRAGRRSGSSAFKVLEDARRIVRVIRTPRLSRRLASARDLVRGGA